ncbi:MAG: formylglycine-generating enzyme family protein [Akkermansiaceae bacterium]|jgi:formylglycine-generating enzyme required for sulfatase activity|nr:formylglycine-generating enzyme family protein [Akkermansiaceae bacterium]
MKTIDRKLCALALVTCIPAATATAAVTIDWVAVGNAGNASDSTGFGAVGYDYLIARNETTIGQYAEFLNAVAKTDTYGLYNTGMTTSYINGISRGGSPGDYSYAVTAGSEHKPITYTNWFDAARFCNWLHNGQPTGGTQTVGTTEDGAYFLNGATSGAGVAKKAGATVWIPTEDEWYKAAYYDATKGGTGGYWLHANRSDAMTTNDIGVAGAANFQDANGYATYVGGASWAITDAGAYGANSRSFYGTDDQGGNVWEWNDAVVGSSRGLRGGSWANGENELRSLFRNFSGPDSGGAGIGFRVASVPEPSSMVAAMMFSGLLLTRRKR